MSPSHNGYDILVSSTDYDSARMALCVRRMLERKVEGVAIMTSEMDNHLVDQLAHRNVPMVFLDVGPTGEGISHIVVDYAMGVNEAVEHLLSLGHRQNRIHQRTPGLEIRAHPADPPFCARSAGMGSTKISAWSGDGDHTVDGGLNAMARMLESHCSPTAMLASNDLTAIGMMRAVRRAGSLSRGTSRSWVSTISTWRSSPNRP